MTESKAREFNSDLAKEVGYELACDFPSDLYQSHTLKNIQTDSFEDGARWQYYQLQAELATLRQVKSSMSDVIDQKDKQIEALKAREIAHLALIRDLQKGIKAKDELLDKAINGCPSFVEGYRKLREGKK